MARFADVTKRSYSQRDHDKQEPDAPDHDGENEVKITEESDKLLDEIDELLREEHDYLTRFYQQGGQ